MPEMRKFPGDGMICVNHLSTSNPLPFWVKFELLPLTPSVNGEMESPSW